MRKAKSIMSWDESEIFDSRVKDLMQESLSEDEARNRMYKDADGYEIEWEDMCNYLSEVMAEKNKSVYWKADVNGFGWRHLNGHKFFKAEKGVDLLRAILPNTDCTFYIYKHGRNGLKINNFHHDSPTGAEWYYVLPATQKEINDGYFN